MGTKAGVGYSNSRNPFQAGKEAATKALESGGILKPDMVIVYATIGYDQETIVKTIREHTGKAPLSGCSAEGVITQGIADESNFGVTVMTISSDDIRFNNTFATGLKEGNDLIGEKVAKNFEPYLKDDTIACVVLGDCLYFSFDPFLRGFEKIIKPHHDFIPIFGGTSGDNWQFKVNYQYHNDTVFTNGVSSILLSGNGNIASAVSHGCVPIGKERKITHCSGTKIFEVDDKPIFEVLKEYFQEDEGEDWNKAVVNLCLGYKTDPDLRDDYNEHIIRFFFARDEKEGSVTISSEAKEGMSIWITRRDQELIRKSCITIGEKVNSQLKGGKAKFVLHFDCAGRGGKVVIRDQDKMEMLNLLQGTIDSDIPWLGFYSFGELAPIGKHNLYHNYTAAVMAVY